MEQQTAKREMRMVMTYTYNDSNRFVPVSEVLHFGLTLFLQLNSTIMRILCLQLGS